MGEKMRQLLSLFHYCENVIYKAIHRPARKLSLVTRCYTLGQPNYPNELMIVCIGDINFELMACIMEDKFRLRQLINYLPRAIVSDLQADYLTYDFLLNDWRKELLKWFNR